MDAQLTGDEYHIELDNGEDVLLREKGGAPDCDLILLAIRSRASVLPIPKQPFKEKTGLRAEDSVKDFPQKVVAPEGAPNILLVLTDDVQVS